MSSSKTHLIVLVENLIVMSVGTLLRSEDGDGSENIA